MFELTLITIIILLVFLLFIAHKKIDKVTKDLKTTNAVLVQFKGQYIEFFKRSGINADTWQKAIKQLSQRTEDLNKRLTVLEPDE